MDGMHRIGPFMFVRLNFNENGNFAFGECYNKWFNKASFAVGTSRV